MEKYPLRVLANGSVRYQCPCCGYFTLTERGAYDICKVCFWEDEDLSVYGYPTVGPTGGANHVDLDQARRNFLAFGASEDWVKQYTRPPWEDERPDTLPGARTS